jgi:hypothetical protein
VQGRVAIGEQSGERVERLGRRRAAPPLFLPGELSDIDGFSLHAKVESEVHDRDGLERLCRYVARPPLANPSRSKLADLLQRVEIDAFRSPYCGGKRKLIALLTDDQVARKFLSSPRS